MRVLWQCSVTAIFVSLFGTQLARTERPLSLPAELIGASDLSLQVGSAGHLLVPITTPWPDLSQHSVLTELKSGVATLAASNLKPTPKNGSKAEDVCKKPENQKEDKCDSILCCMFDSKKKPPCTAPVPNMDCEEEEEPTGKQKGKEKEKPKESKKEKAKESKKTAASNKASDVCAKKENQNVKACDDIDCCLFDPRAKPNKCTAPNPDMECEALDEPAAPAKEVKHGGGFHPGGHRLPQEADEEEDLEDEEQAANQSLKQAADKHATKAKKYPHGSFESIDVDEDGEIDANEFEVVLKETYKKNSLKLFADVDKEHQGTINKAAFDAAIAAGKIRTDMFLSPEQITKEFSRRQKTIPKSTVNVKGKSGTQACSHKDFSSGVKCLAVGCCTWDGASETCTSAVGNEPCDKAEREKDNAKKGIPGGPLPERGSFKSLDLDNSGTIDFFEFWGSLEDTDTKKAMALFKSIDKDGNGQIDEGEFEAAKLDKKLFLPPADVRIRPRVHRGSFHSVDVDSRGTVDFTEFISALVDSEKTDKDRARTLFEDVDRDKSGEIDKKEWTKAVMAGIISPNMFKTPDQIKKVHAEAGGFKLGSFASIDFDRSGQVDVNEFRLGLRDEFSDKAKDLFDRIDTDSSTKIDEGEFNQAYKTHIITKHMFKEPFQLARYRVPRPGEKGHWDTLDKNPDTQQLDKEGFNHCFNKDMDSEKLGNMFKMLDVDGSGEIDRDEWNSAIKGGLIRRELLRDPTNIKRRSKPVKMKSIKNGAQSHPHHKPTACRIQEVKDAFGSHIREEGHSVGKWNFCYDFRPGAGSVDIFLPKFHKDLGPSDKSPCNVVGEIHNPASVNVEAGALDVVEGQLGFCTNIGGVKAAFFRALFSAEAIFLNSYIGRDGPVMLTISGGTPGVTFALDIPQETEFFIKPGAFVAGTPNVRVTADRPPSWLKLGLMQGSLYWTRVHLKPYDAEPDHNGVAWVIAMGHAESLRIPPGDKHYFDPDHLLAFGKHDKFKITMAGSESGNRLRAFVGSGEGFILSYEPPDEKGGHIVLQLRSVYREALHMANHIPHECVTKTDIALGALDLTASALDALGEPANASSLLDIGGGIPDIDMPNIELPFSSLANTSETVNGDRTASEGTAAEGASQSISAKGSTKEVNSIAGCSKARNHHRASGMHEDDHFQSTLDFNMTRTGGSLLDAVVRFWGKDLGEPLVEKVDCPTSKLKGFALKDVSALPIAHHMCYRLHRSSVQVVFMSSGAKIKSEPGSASYFSREPQKEIKVQIGMAGGGFFKAFSSYLAGESIIQNTYERTEDAEGDDVFLGFGAKKAGDVVPIILKPGDTYLLKVGSYVCGTENVEISFIVDLKEMFLGMTDDSNSLFLQKASVNDDNPGVLFVEAAGIAKMHRIAGGRDLKIDNGLYLASEAPEHGNKYFGSPYELTWLGMGEPADLKTRLLNGEALMMEFKEIYHPDKRPRVVMAQSMNFKAYARKIVGSMPGCPCSDYETYSTDLPLPSTDDLPIPSFIQTAIKVKLQRQDAVHEAGRKQRLLWRKHRLQNVAIRSRARGRKRVRMSHQQQNHMHVARGHQASGQHLESTSAFVQAVQTERAFSDTFISEMRNSSQTRPPEKASVVCKKKENQNEDACDSIDCCMFDTNNKKCTAPVEDMECEAWNEPAVPAKAEKAKEKKKAQPKQDADKEFKDEKAAVTHLEENNQDPNDHVPKAAVDPICKLKDGTKIEEVGLEFGAAGLKIIESPREGKIEEQEIETPPHSMVEYHNIAMKSHVLGGVGSAIMRKMDGSSAMWNQYNNKVTSQGPGWGLITVIGAEDLMKIKIDSRGKEHKWRVNTGHTLAATSEVKIGAKWVISGIIMGQGLMQQVLQTKEEDQFAWVWGYGHLHRHILQEGDVLCVDESHYVAAKYPTKWSFTTGGGVLYALFGGKGLMMKFRGPGEVITQSKNIKGYAEEKDRKSVV